MLKFANCKRLPKTMLSMELSMVAFLWLVNVFFPIDLRQHPGGDQQTGTNKIVPNIAASVWEIRLPNNNRPFGNCLYKLFIWDGLLLFNRLDLGVSKNVECLDIWPLIGKAMTSHKMLGHTGPSLNRGGSLPEPVPHFYVQFYVQYNVYVHVVRIHIYIYIHMYMYTYVHT